MKRYEVMFWRGMEALCIGYQSVFTAESKEEAWEIANALLAGMAKRGATECTINSDCYTIVV